MTTLAQQIEGIRTVTGSTERDLLFPSPATGQKVHNLATDRIERWSGSAWVDSLMGTPGWYDALTNGLVGDGVTSNTAALSLLANTTIPSTGGTILFRPGTYKIGSSVTIPAYTRVVMMTGAKFLLDSGVILLFNGPFEAPLSQVFTWTATGKALFGPQSVHAVFPEWWGAVADGVTDSTAAFNKAVNLAHGNDNVSLAGGQRVRLQRGTYLADILHDNGYTLVEGAGQEASKIKAWTANGFAWQEMFSSSAWRRATVLKDFTFVGDNDTGGGRSGFVFGSAPAGVVTYTTGAESYGRVSFHRISFKSTKYGVRKPWGNISNDYHECAWWGTSEYCYHAAGTETGTPVGAVVMQTGGGEAFIGCHMEGATKAAIYINDSSSAGNNTFRGLIVEACPGFAVFVKNYPNAGSSPMVFENCWFEVNADFSAAPASVTIDGDVYTYGGTTPGSALSSLFFRNAQTITLRNCKLTGESIQLVSAAVLEDGCAYHNDTSLMDSASTRLIDNMYATICNIRKGIVRSYHSMGVGVFGGTGHIFKIPPRVRRAYGYTAVYAESFSGIGPWNFAGTSSINATSVADGQFQPRCMEVVVPTAKTEVPNYAPFSFAITVNRWYVYTLAVKQVGALGGSVANLTVGGDGGAVTLCPNFAHLLEQDKWVTVGGVGQCVGSGNAMLPRIVNNTGADVTLRFADVQVVEFLTQDDAINYFNSRLLASKVELVGQATYDPGNLVDAAGVTTTVTVTGAVLGDRVSGVSFSLDLQGITVTAWVSAADTVSVRFQNETGGALDLASGTLRVKVDR